MRTNWRPSYLLIAVILLILTLALLGGKFAAAAPAEGRGGPQTCLTQTYTARPLKYVNCFLLRCGGLVTIHDAFGGEYSAAVTGWKLREGQRVNVEATVCTDGLAYNVRIVR